MFTAYLCAVPKPSLRKRPGAPGGLPAAQEDTQMSSYSSSYERVTDQEHSAPWNATAGTPATAAVATSTRFDLEHSGSHASESGPRPGMSSSAINAARQALFSRGGGGARALSAAAAAVHGGVGHAASSAAAAAAPAPAATAPFIERVKALGSGALLGKFPVEDGRFDRVLEGMEVTRVTPGEVVAELVVGPGLQNTYGALHGGATCTLVDVVGTMALLTLDPTRAGVSVELSTTFTAAAKLGERLRVVGRVLKTGKRLGFTQVDLFRADGTLVATGRHTKAL
jgi:acyl-coenzyme A thioesterase 13